MITTCLIVVSISPEDTDTDSILLQVVDASHVRARKEAKAAGVNFQGLINSKFRAEVSNALLVIWIDVVGMFKRFGQKTHNILVLMLIVLRGHVPVLTPTQRLSQAGFVSYYAFIIIQPFGRITHIENKQGGYKLDEVLTQSLTSKKSSITAR